MSDDPDHHDPAEPAKPLWGASDLIVAVLGIAGMTTLLILVSTGVIHQ